MIRFNCFSVPSLYKEQDSSSFQRKEKKDISIQRIFFSCCYGIQSTVIPVETNLSPTEFANYQLLKSRLSITPTNSISNLFHEIKTPLDKYRYQGVDEIKKEISEILAPLYNKKIQEDVLLLLDKIVFLLQDLKIYYHDTQHTLEVALGVAQMGIEALRKKEIKDERHLLLAITAALFHDIGYCNADEVRSQLFLLEKKDYEELFSNARGRDFSSNFDSFFVKIKPSLRQEKKPPTGGEFHKYHVYLGQIIMRWVLEGTSLEHKNFLLEPAVMEIMGAMISLTDINPQALSYRINRKEFLSSQKLEILGDILATSDLLTQLASSDRIKKGLSLYHEFFLGKEDGFCESGLHLLATATDFYETFAKNCLSTQALNFLDTYFDRKEIENKYRLTLSHVLFLHSAFEPIFAKLRRYEEITDRDVAILQGLHENGLPEIVVQFFSCVVFLQKGNVKQDGFTDLYNRLLAISSARDSFEEIVLGDEIRSLFINFSNTLQLKKEQTDEFIRQMRKPGLLDTRDRRRNPSSEDLSRRRLASMLTEFSNTQII